MSTTKPTTFEFPKEMVLRQRSTPIGEMLFNHLFKGANKHDPKKPKFSTVLLFSKSDEKAMALAQEIRNLIKQATDYVQKKLGPQYDAEGNVVAIKPANPPVRVWLEKQPDGTKVPTDKLAFSFSQPAEKTVDGKRVAAKLDVRDRSGTKQWPSSVEVGNGSRGRVFFMARPFYVPAQGVGVTLGIDAVQVAEARSRVVEMDAIDDGTDPVEPMQGVPDAPFSDGPKPDAAGGAPTSGGAF